MQNEYRLAFQAKRLNAYSDMVIVQALSVFRYKCRQKYGEQTCYFQLGIFRAGSLRAFLDLLGTSFIKVPNTIPENLQNKEKFLVNHLRDLEQMHTTSDQYYNTYKELKEVWNEMISLDPDTHDYVELRQGHPVNIKGILELLGDINL